MKQASQGLILTMLFGMGLLIVGTQKVESGESERMLETATFGGGCFWCMEHAFDEVAGVVSTLSGYMGGETENPSYEAVSSGKTGHAEVVQVIFDSSQISYEELLAVYWRNIDPTVRNRQFCDWGNQYRSVIFYHNAGQKELALASKIRLDGNKSFEEPIVTEMTQAGAFYPAEEYHQDFHRKNPIRYKVYRFSCGRDQRLRVLWGSSKMEEG